MKLIITGAKRKDNKYPTTYIFNGGANGFGGSYEGRRYNKLKTAEQILSEIRANPSIEYTIPSELLRVL